MCTQVLQYYASATEHDKLWYKAWHAWAYMNYEAVLFYKQQTTDHGQSRDQDDHTPSIGQTDNDNVFEDSQHVSTTSWRHSGISVTSGHECVTSWRAYVTS